MALGPHGLHDQNLEDQPLDLLAASQYRAPIPNRWLGFVQRSHNYTETKLWVFFLGFRTPNQQTFLMGSMGRWVFFLWWQRQPHHWVLNEFDGDDLITKSRTRLERVWVSQSLNQIRVWHINEDEILRLETFHPWRVRRKRV